MSFAPSRAGHSVRIFLGSKVQVSWWPSSWSFDPPQNRSVLLSLSTSTSTSTATATSTSVSVSVSTSTLTSGTTASRRFFSKFRPSRRDHPGYALPKPKGEQGFVPVEEDRMDNECQDEQPQERRRPQQEGDDEGQDSFHSNAKKQKIQENKDGSFYNRGEGRSNTVPHPGSFACAALREQFGIELPASPSVEEETEKRQKKKVAMLLSYLGTRYGGFQMNEGQRTLQAEVELALYKCRFISQANFGFPFKYSWSTSGRTDKGVHACAQVISAKIELLPQQTLDQALDEINQVLPPDICVLEINRVSKAFCAKTQRDRVRYQYMIPSFLFQNVEAIRTMYRDAGCGEGNDRPAGDPLSLEQIQTLKSQLNSYRATPEQLALLKKALHCYEGTHPFHNFTKGVNAAEARADRYILSFHVEDPIVFPESGDMEWIPTQVLGQSFMIHQIRKMVAMAIDVARGAAPLATLQQALDRANVIRVAPAPAQGLYLDMSFYGGYNRKKQRSNPDYPDLEWTKEDSDVYRRWKEFRNGTLMKHVAAEEHKEGNFLKYLYQQEFVNQYQVHYKLDRFGGDEAATAAKDDDNNPTKLDGYAIDAQNLP